MASKSVPLLLTGIGLPIGFPKKPSSEKAVHAPPVTDLKTRIEQLRRSRDEKAARNRILRDTLDMSRRYEEKLRMDAVINTRSGNVGDKDSDGLSPANDVKVVSEHKGPMDKKAGMLKDEIDFIRKGIGENALTKDEMLRSSAVGAALFALAGAGIGAATGRYDKKKKKSNRVRRAIIGAMLASAPGALAGPLVAQYRKYMAGVPFDNSAFDKADHKPGDKVYIGVAGSSNGENESWFRDEMKDRFGDNAYMLRHVDRKKLDEVYKKLKDLGLDVTIVGHSSGGSTAAKFLNDHPDANGYLIDPVSWLYRKVPSNSIVFTADKSTRHGGVSENYIADMGGRWNYEGDNSVVFKGSHSNRMLDIIRDFVSKGVKPGDANVKMPSYVTSMFGKKGEY